MTFTGRDCHKATGNVTICGDVIDEIIYLGVKLSKKDRYKMVVPEVSQFWSNRLKDAMPAIHFQKYCCTFYGAPLWRNDGASRV